MATPNRAAKITKLITALKKKFKPAPAPPKNRPLLETLLMGCLLEDSPHEAAEKALADLEQGYFDWNEVRVSTKRELTGALTGLTDPAAAAERLKNALQSVFESVYSYDLEAMKKQNLGVSIKELEKHRGVTPFVVAYTVQNSLSGHSIPINKGLLIALEVLEVITPAEAANHTVPGLERTVPKNKGIEVGSVLHQLGVEIGKNPYGPKARKLLTDLDPTCKDRLPKRPPPPPKPEPPKKQPAKPQAKKGDPKKSAAAKQTDAKKAAAKPSKPAAKKPAAKSAAAAKTPVAKKKAVVKKAAAKTPTKKKVVKKKVIKKKVAKKATPTKKKVVKKVAKKKVAKKVGKTTKKKSSNLRKKKPR